MMARTVRLRTSTESRDWLTNAVTFTPVSICVTFIPYLYSSTGVGYVVGYVVGEELGEAVGLRVGVELAGTDDGWALGWLLG